MPRRIAGLRRPVAVGLALLAAAVLAACGGSSGSGQAQTLLRQTFSGPHAVKSGILSFALTLTPSGSSIVHGPISLSLSGPFQSRGSGQLPASNFTIAVDALGHHGALGLISTGTSGYVTLQGAAYQLPAAYFQRLASSFAGAAGGSGTGGLSKLGIDPLHWLTSASIVGPETVAGASTTHIRAKIAVTALLDDLNTFLHKASASGATGTTAIPTTIPAATRQKIAGEVQNPTVDVWTGTADKTLRKLSLNLGFPIRGQVSTALGGLSSAGIALTLQYANLNQSQTIVAPGNLQPFAGFATKLRAILAQVQGGLGGLGGAGLGSSTTGSGGAGSSATGSSSSSSSASPSSSVQKYSLCIQQANGDITKMQKCAPLLNGR